MKWRWYIVGSLCLFAFLLIVGNVRKWSSASIALPRVQVNIKIGQANVLAEMATTPESQARGLSGRVNLGRNEGMWFPFSKSKAPAFWMRDMLMPIDIIWVRQGRVVAISEQVPPPAPNTPLRNLPLYASPVPADAVLEVNAGFAKIHGVTTGTAVSVVPAS